MTPREEQQVKGWLGGIAGGVLLLVLAFFASKLVAQNEDHARRITTLEVQLGAFQKQLDRMEGKIDEGNRQR